MNKRKLAAILTAFAVWTVIEMVPAGAQTAPPAAPAAGAPSGELQEVTVSASAISIAGYQAPTPVTAVGLQQLESNAKMDIADAMRQLPQFGVASSPMNSVDQGEITNGTAGLDLVNLRNLGTNRTLVLFDGQRVVSSGINSQGGVDLTNVPQTLIERVDVVTGGASSIWGSDAVAGVVNLILNKSFNGAQVNLEYGNTFASALPQYKATVTLGTGFDDNRGHIEVAGSYWDSPNTFFSPQIPGMKYQRIVNNPAFTPGCDCPKLVLADGVGLTSATTGGIITGNLTSIYGGPGGLSPLQNIYFGPGGTPGLFNQGNVSAGFFSNGGTPNAETMSLSYIAAPLQNETAFGLITFNISDNLRASLQLNYGQDRLYGNSYSDDQYGTVPIYSGNPYIPASVQAQLTGLGLPGFMLGTTNMNNLNSGGTSLQSEIDSVGIPVIYESRQLFRYVFTLDGTIGSNWTWNAYFQHGETDTYETALNNEVQANLVNAEDAVTVGSYSAHYAAANYPNPLGLPNGTITCLSNLLPAGAAKQTTNCVPLNVFGIGVASEAAIAYINGLARAGGDSVNTDVFENVAAASAQGKLPFGMPAGQVAAAVGAVYRKESGVGINCGALCQNRAFALGNFPDFFGNYDVKEAFIELNAPLLKDQVVKDLSFDAAYRGTDYSTSGFVSTYKFGLTSQLIDPLRLRASYSYDIRAGNLFELFSLPTPIQGNVVDPHSGKVVTIFGTTEGNRSLQPEKAETRTAGFVLTPIPGLTASLDWYYIRIKDAISEGFSSSVTLAECAAGIQLLCNNIQYDGPGGALSQIFRIPVNVNSQTTSGLDFNGDYRSPFMNGSLDFNSALAYQFEQTITQFGTPFDTSNCISNYNCKFQGIPKFKGTVAVTYSEGGWLGTVQVRMIGAAYNNTSWNGAPSIIAPENNEIPFITYWDLRGSYQFGNGIQLYAALDNALNKYPPVIPSQATTGTDWEQPYVDSVYDSYGRVYRIGLRARF